MAITSRISTYLANHGSELAVVVALAGCGAFAAYALNSRDTISPEVVRSLSWGGLTNKVADAIRDKLEADRVASEKKTAAQKELEQARLSQEATKASVGAVADNAGMAPDACTSLETEMNAVDAKASSITWQKAMTGGNVRTSVGVDSAGKSMRESLDIHNEIYCSDIDEARGRCYVPGNGLQNADIMASTIMAPNGGSTLSDEEFEASRQFVSNVTVGVPVQNLQPAFESTGAGQAYLLEQRRYAARMSLSQNALNRIIASQRVRN